MYILYLKVCLIFFLGEGGGSFEKFHTYGDVIINCEMCISNYIVLLRCCRSSSIYMQINVIQKNKISRSRI